jgi:hypothetical protein
MIISASRRTDIPAFYGEWFKRRLESKKVWARNPVNPRIITEICLDPEYIECIVFWTKNPKNMLEYLPRIDRLGHRYYFQFTITPYDSKIEKNLDKADVVDTFIKLSGLIGREKVIWRYDPVFINEYYTLEYHTSRFELLCKQIGNHTDKCVISFVDSYNFLAGNFRDYHIEEPDSRQIDSLAGNMADIAGKYHLSLAACSEKVNLEKYGITRNKCIDNELIEKLFSLKIDYKKDASQRAECGCCKSRDIGAYNTCLHDCVYCYAKKGRNPANYNPDSLLLGDVPDGTEKVNVLKMNRLAVSPGAG